MKRVASGAIRGVAALGWISFFSLFCSACSGLPVLAGIFGGVAATTRFGVSAGVVSGVMLTALVLRRRRAARQQACAHRAGQAAGDG
jgi:hypothetical protein